jgi:glycosyltransferase involved in cell wall biosynthesis
VAERGHFLGYIEENDLPVVYSLATMFANPSLYGEIWLKRRMNAEREKNL